jgi:hypothetical protein
MLFGFEFISFPNGLLAVAFCIFVTVEHAGLSDCDCM